MPTQILESLQALRTELVDLAYSLESQGRVDAADIAVLTAGRIGTLCEEFMDPDGCPSADAVTADTTR